MKKKPKIVTTGMEAENKTVCNNKHCSYSAQSTLHYIFLPSRKSLKFVIKVSGKHFYGVICSWEITFPLFGLFPKANCSVS